jgi:molecular chaperone GrpE (heat shock protein)
VTDDRDRERDADRERERQAPVIKVTDKRRFANLSEVQVPASSEAGTGPDDATAPIDDAADGDALAQARAQAQEYLAHLQRLQAEFDNFRKRTMREQTAALEAAGEPVIRRLLEVLDDFELALMAATSQPDFERFRKGVELVYAKLADALAAEGLDRIDAEGAAFDPERHEALMQTGEGSGEPHVAEVFRNGYTLKGRVIRPAGVRVERS